jgi:hypothetical protein
VVEVEEEQRVLEARGARSTCIHVAEVRQVRRCCVHRRASILELKGAAGALDA